MLGQGAKSVLGKNYFFKLLKNSFCYYSKTQKYLFFFEKLDQTPQVSKKTFKKKKTFSFVEAWPNIR